MLAKSDNLTGLRLAAQKAGSRRKLARLLGIWEGTIRGWERTGEIPAHWLIAIESATGIPREDLRPDLYR